MDRVILHCDVNSFFASVELLEHPELADVPVAVSGSPDRRHGIILAKNEAAKRYGVVTAETVHQALKKCPELVMLPPHHDKYRAYSKQLNAIYESYTDQVEKFSIDESWLDVTGSQKLFGSGREIADEIRRRVREELGLTISVGVSYNKIFAKMGSEYRKPDATTEVTRENYQQILWPQPVGELFFCGWATSQQLNKYGIHTIGDLAQASPTELEKMLGKQGPLLRSYARGEDTAPVKQFDQRDRIKSVGNGITFTRDLRGEADIRTALSSLADTVAGRLRHYGLKCYGVKVDIKNPELKTISRQMQLDSATHLAEVLRDRAMDIIRQAWSMDKPIRLITLTAINLCDESESRQISFFQTEEEADARSESLERAMDDIRARFGSASISFGSVIGNDIGIDL